MATKYHIVSFKVKGPAPQKPKAKKKPVKKKRKDTGYPNTRW